MDQKPGSLGVSRWIRVAVLPALFLSNHSTATSPSQELLMPCMELRSWPTDQVFFRDQMPFNAMFWLPPIDPTFSYNMCREEFIAGRNMTRCIRLLPVEDLEPIPWSEVPFDAYELERDENAIDDDDWQDLLREDCWEIRALGNNGPVDFLGVVCPRGPADTEAPTPPVLTAYFERPFWGTGNNTSDDQAVPLIAECNPFASRVGRGQLRLHLTHEDPSPVLVHIQVHSGENRLFDGARPIDDRLAINVEIGDHRPETIRVQARLIDAAGQLSSWSEASEIVDERMGGCACTSSDPWTLGLLSLCMLRLRRRRTRPI